MCVGGGGGRGRGVKYYLVTFFYIQDNIKKKGMADHNSLALNA